MTEATVTIQLRIENWYEGSCRPVVTTPTVHAPRPDDLDDLDEWAEDHLYPVTGVGRTMGGSAYVVTIAACPDVPELVGREFEYGL